MCCFFEVGSLYLTKTTDDKHVYLFVTKFKEMGTTTQGQPYYAVEFLSPRGKIERTDSITENTLRKIFVEKRKL